MAEGLVILTTASLYTPVPIIELINVNWREARVLSTALCIRRRLQPSVHLCFNEIRLTN
jgi:hypothetical protein